MVTNGQILVFEVSVELYSGLLIIDIKYINKQTNNIYINKQTTVKAGFNLNSIKNFIDMKTTFKNIFPNLIHIDFTIFCLQMSIQIGNVSKQGKAI